MATIEETIKDFQSRKLVPTMKAWEEYVTDPYNLAYNRAFDAYDKTLQKQKASDKAKLDLAMAALSVCGGSIMTAVFAETTAKAVAAKLTVDFICKHNMDRAFKVAHFTATNKTAEFIVGALWDQGGKIISAKTKELLAQNANNFPAVDKLVKKPYEIKAALDSFVKSSYLKVHQVCEDILKAKGTEADKQAAFAKLVASDYCQPPKKSPHPRDLEKRIEFIFYMQLILAKDHLVTKMFVHRAMGGAHPVTLSKKPITQQPGTKGYPKSSTTKPDGVFSPLTMTYVDYDRIGQDIIDRINKLYKELYKTKSDFIDSEWFGEKANEQMLLKANRKINELAGTSIQAISQRHNEKKK